MFKYYNAVTNRSGDALPDYYVRLFDASGTAVDIFADANGTPISTDSGKDNAAKSDDNGMLRFYVENGTYDIRYYDSDDNYKDVEPGIPMFEASGIYDDFASTTAGKGASLVALEGGSDVQAGLNARPTSAVLAADDGATKLGAGNGRTQDGKNKDAPSMFDYVPAGQHAAIIAGTTDYDATDDFHDAFAELDGTGKTLLVPGAKYRVGELTIDGSNFKINSKGVWLHQWGGLLVDEFNHPIITVAPTASNIDIGSWRLKGNLDDDAEDLPGGVDATMHGVAVMSAKDIVIGDLYGEDLLGDVLYTYGRTTSEAEMMRNLRAGVISGSNIYRCLVAMVGGEATIEGIIQKGPVGFRDFNAEPNPGSGTYQPIEAVIRRIVGSQVSIISGDDAVINKSVRIDHADLDGSRIVDSSTPYPNHSGANATAFALSHCDKTSVGNMRLRNYASYPVRMFGSWRQFSIDTLDFADCGADENQLKAIVVQRHLDDEDNELPPPEGALLRIGEVVGTLENSADNLPTSAGRGVVRSFGGTLSVEIGSCKASNGMIGSGLSGMIGVKGEWDFGGGHGEIALQTCSNLVVRGMKAVNSANAIGLFSCDDVTFINCEGEFGGGFDYTSMSTNIVSIGKAITGAVGIALANGEVRVDDVKVLGSRVAGDPGAASDPTTTQALANWLRTVITTQGIGGT